MPPSTAPAQKMKMSSHPTVIAMAKARSNLLQMDEIASPVARNDKKGGNLE